MSLATGAPARVAGTTRTAPCPSVLIGKSDLGRMAFVDRGQLRVLMVASCRTRTLVSRGVGAPVRWSADGRYLAYGAGKVVPAGGGVPTSPLGHLSFGWGSGVPGWVWSPVGHRLAGVTAGGGVLVGGPGAPSERLLPDGWGATSVAWSPDGQTLAVSRSLYAEASPPYHQEIWLLDLSTGAKRMLFALPRGKVAPPLLSGFSPDGKWLLAWEDTDNSASLAADGLPLATIAVKDGRAVPVGKGTLVYGDFVSWCTGNLLAYVDNTGGRQVTLNDRVNFAGPAPNWPVVTPAGPGAKAQLSFVSPSCSPPGLFMVAAAVGPTTQDEPFGHEHRRIWVLPYTGGNWRPLEAPPPKGSTDELPLWSSDGHWVAFIRTTWTGTAGAGYLYLLYLGSVNHFNGHALLVGPIAPLGTTSNYYGHYNWAAQVAWYSR